jgi:hypothetical protein
LTAPTGRARPAKRAAAKVKHRAKPAIGSRGLRRKSQILKAKGKTLRRKSHDLIDKNRTMRNARLTRAMLRVLRGGVVRKTSARSAA